MDTAEPGGAGVTSTRIFSAAAFEEILREWSAILVEYLRTAQDGPVMRWAAPADLQRLFPADLPEEGIGSTALLDQFRTAILPWCQHHAHRHVAGHMVARPLPVAAVADLATSLLNQGMGVWEVAPGPVALTQCVIGWLARTAGFGPAADGIITTGGTEANLTALLAARSRAFGAAVVENGLGVDERPVVLVSPLAHYSIARAAAVTGLGRRNVRAVALDAELRMVPGALEESIRAARRDGHRVVAVVATAGTTAAGTFDPIDAIATICERHGVWLHVDGAHGASLLLTSRGRGLLAGVDRADSLAWDPHKMLFVPAALGVLLVSDRRDLARVFDDRPDYLFDHGAADDPAWNFTRKNLRCTQRFDALRLWAALAVHGRRTLAALIERTLDVAHHLWDRVREEACFEPLIEPPFNIVCFRFVPREARDDPQRLDRLQEAVRARLLHEGSAWITTTVLGGRTFLRVAVMNPETSEEDVDELLRLVRAAGAIAPAGR